MFEPVTLFPNSLMTFFMYLGIEARQFFAGDFQSGWATLESVPISETFLSETMMTQTVDLVFENSLIILL